MSMLTKFDLRSARVKGLSFHKQRPWILCGLHDGTIQIWDYRMKTCVDTYSDHTGSVRGVDFHETQPLFVSGADDLLIKVWDYKLRRCLFTLMGHIDYIRSTFFHHEQPWIVSSSDDFTVRIWNWQNRSSVATLPGHNHYVMCAQFHPRDDLIVSASLDKSIRVWDMSSLRVRKQDTGLKQDLFGTSDALLKFQLEGHDKGVNWASFHPTKPYIVSGSDDRTVRVWRMTEMSCHEEAQMRGHMNNVCCVVFFKDFVISCSEDRTIRVWDTKQRANVMQFRRDIDRYWILSTHPSANMIAAGHDGGMHVFKLFRERPAHTTKGNVLYYIHENTLYAYDYENSAESKFNLGAHLYPPNTLSCNPADSQAVASYINGAVIEVFTIPRPGYPVDSNVVKRSGIADAVFFGPNKCAYAENGKLGVASVQGDRAKYIDENFPCQRVFVGPVGCVACSNEGKVYLYQVAQHTAIAEAAVEEVRYVVWDKEFNKVAFIAKNTITVMTKRFKLITAISQRSVRVKSAVFDETRDVLYFTTANHLKYCNLRSGEDGTICTVKNTAYLVKAVGDTVWLLTRNGKVFSKQFDNLELNFKLKLQQQSYREIIRIIQSKQLKGQALVGYLHKHGHNEIALHFVTDPLTRFNLALECGAVDIARATATELNQAPIWRRLAECATRFGDIQLAQFANSKAGNYHAGGLLFLITGNLASLGHMVDSAKDDNFKLHYGMFLGDVKQRIQILAKANQLPLAYATARSTGLDDVAEALLEKMEPEVAERVRAVHCYPSCEQPSPATITDNWPLLQVEESMFARLLKEPGQFDPVPAADGDDDGAVAGAGWDDDDDDDLLDANDGGGGPFGDGHSEGGGEGGWDDDLDIDVNAAFGAAVPAEQKGSGDVYVVPREFPPVSQHWVDTYNIPAFHVAAGSFKTALELLQRQIGLRNAIPLKGYMLALWASVNAARPGWLAQSSTYTLVTQPPAEVLSGKTAPLLPDYLPELSEKLRTGYQLFMEGKFVDSLDVFQGILHKSVFATVKNDQQKQSLRELQSVAAEYARALSVQLHLRCMEASSNESLQLALYFTHFKLNRAHLSLALSQALNKAYKKKNLKTAGAIARRLLEQDPPQNKAQQAAAVVAEAERNPTNAVEVDYDERNPFVLCSVTHKPMYKGTMEPIRCSYCHSAAQPAYKTDTCPVCKIGAFGVDCAGIQNAV